MTARLRWLVLGAVLGVLAAGLACSPSEPDAPPGGAKVTRLPDPEDVVDEELMLALAEAKNFHHKAKVYMGDGNLAEAIVQVQSILAIPFPAGAPEGDDVRMDARAMLAKLLAAQGKVDEAMTVVDQGIGGARRDSFFVANLYTVKGEVHRARAALLEGQADPAAQARLVDEKRAAIEAFTRSNEIVHAIQKELAEERKRQRAQPQGVEP
jgi:hypothetical protein